MGIDRAALEKGLAALARREPLIAERVAACGLPNPRVSPRGHATLLRTIIGQQVSVASATAVWQRLCDAVGHDVDCATIAAAPDEALRAAGLSRQKAGYVRSLAELVVSGAVDLAALPDDDEAAIATLTRIRGIGRWSAEIYLLFADGRPDIWPAGDLAIQVEVGRILGHETRPSEVATRALAEPWRPYRGAMAVFAWHSYQHRQGRPDREAVPV